MILIFHIAIAILSLGYTTFLFFIPSRAHIKIAEYLILATLVSGIGLVILQPAVLAHVCVTGIIYLAIVSLGIVFAQRKLATASLS